MKLLTAATKTRSRELQLLRRSDELLRLAMEVGRIGVFETDLKQKQTHFSPELCSIIGLPSRTVMPSEQAWQFIHETDREAMRAIAEAAATSHEGKWSGVHRVRRVDGKILWVSSNGRRIYRKTRRGLQPVRSMGVVIDITHLKEIEDALRESELRLRFALEAAQMGTFVADMTAGEVSIDALEAHLLGLPDETRFVSTELLRKRIPLTDLTESDAKKERLLQQNEPYHHELRLRMQDGSERWLSTHADVRSNRVFGINFDITQRKQAEAQLRASEERLRIATSGAALGVFEWDTDLDNGGCVNERMYEIFGRRRADGPLCKRQFVHTCLHPDDVDLFETALTTARQTSSSFRTTVRTRRAAAVERWPQIDGAMHESTSDRCCRLIGNMAELSQHKSWQQHSKQR